MAITRRAFLQVSAGGVALAAGAPFARGSNKSGLDPIVLGEGEHRYECVHDCLRIPPHIALGNTHGIAVDSAGFIHLKHTVHAASQTADAVCTFDPGGKFVRSLGAEFRGGAHGLTLTREKAGDFLWLCDCNRGVVRKTTLTGETVLDVAWPEGSGLYNSKGEFKPTNLAVISDSPPGAAWSKFAGHFFVADGYGKSWIHHYAPDGTYLRSFGGPGKERGQTSCPHGIAVDARQGDPRLVVADRSNRRLQYFSLEGRHQGFVQGDLLRSPCHFDTRGELLLVPDLDARVTLLGKDNKAVAQLGDGGNFALRDKPREQFLPGKFIAPHSACFDAKGDIIVVEWVEVGRVTRLRKLS